MQLEDDVQIAVESLARANPEPLQTTLRSRRHIRRHSQRDEPVRRRHVDLSAHRRFENRHRQGHEKILPFAPIIRIRRHVHRQQEVARRPPVSSRIAHTAQSNLLTRFDARGYLYLKILRLPRVRIAGGDGYGSADNRRSEGNRDVRGRVGALRGGVLTTRSSSESAKGPSGASGGAAPHSAAKSKLSENIFHIDARAPSGEPSVGAETAKSSKTAASPGKLLISLAVFVVHFALIGVLQSLESFLNLLKLLLRFFHVVGVEVGVILSREIAISLLNFVLSRVFRNA